VGRLSELLVTAKPFIFLHEVWPRPAALSAASTVVHSGDATKQCGVQCCEHVDSDACLLSRVGVYRRWLALSERR
jgi:hypothetical protein